MNIDFRRIVIVKEAVLAEGDAAAARGVTRVAACAVIGNPLAGRNVDDLEVLVNFGHALGERLIGEALSVLPHPVVAYGKAAIVGLAGDIEHGAAVLHLRMGKPLRAAIGGGKAVIPSNVKIGGPGVAIDIPLGHKDDPWLFDYIDTMTVMVPNGPRHDEIVAAVVVADGARARQRARSSAEPTVVVDDSRLHLRDSAA
jgi:hypothetical protein